VPLDTGERLERLSASTGIAETMARLDQMFAGIQHLEQLMGQVLERLERSQAPAIAPSPPEASPPASIPPKAAVVQRLQAMKANGLSLQAMADRLNAESVPTLSGTGRWQKGTIGKLLAQHHE
jgi:hypothetical protein